MGSLARDRDFRLFWAGHTVSAVGTHVTAVALPLTAALTLDAGAAGVSAVATAGYLPSVALPLLAGHWLEHRRRRPVMIAADVLRAAALGAVPVAWGFGAMSLGLRVAARLGYGRAFAVSLALSTGVPLALPLLPGRGLSYGVLLAACQLLSGIGLGSANVLSVTIRQLLIPRTALARSNGAYRTFTFGVLPLGAALGGVLGGALGTTRAMAVGSAGIALSALPMFTREIRTLRDPHTQRAAASGGTAVGVSGPR